MTVKDLIEELQDFPGDMPIFVDIDLKPVNLLEIAGDEDSPNLLVLS